MIDRKALLVVLGLVTTALIAAFASLADSNTNDPEMVEYLFVQNATSATLADGVLTLGGINADTLYFSDRPERIVGRVKSKDFVDHWATGTDNFKADPPNAVLSLLEGGKAEDITVELQNPRLVGSNLTYDVKVLGGSKSVKGGASALFIDLIGMPMTPMSYAGVARRTTRRAVMYR